MMRRKDQLPGAGRIRFRLSTVCRLLALPPAVFAHAVHAQEAAPADSFVPTTFELARTSDGGLLLVVGNAEPGALVELIEGTIVVAQAEANARGEWVLAPMQLGDDSDGPFGIRTTTADGRYQYLSTRMIVQGEDGVAVVAAATPQIADAVPPDPNGPNLVPSPEIETPASPSGDLAGKPESPSEDPVPLPIANLTAIVETGGGAGVRAGGAFEDLLRITVRRGDTLWEIAQRYLGSGARYPAIVAANPDTIRNPARLWPGDVLILPASPR